MCDLYLWGAVDWTVPYDTKVDPPNRVIDFPLYLPMRTPLPEVTQVACGAKFTLLLLKTGTVMGFGNNELGQLGIPATTATVVEYPIALTMNTTDSIIDLAAGNTHSLALTIAGTMLSTGDNRMKQLGTGHAETRSRWTPITYEGKVTAIAAGYESSYAVTNAGELLTWGGNRKGCLAQGIDYGQLENEKAVSNVNRPQAVEYFLDKGVRISKIAAGHSHFVALSTSGDVYTCGDGAYGKLGVGNIDTQWVPVKITFPFRKYPEMVTNVFAGADITFITRECAVLGTMLYSCGRIGADFLGILSPELVMDLCGKGLTGVSVGKNHYLAWTREGTVYTWGNNKKCSSNAMLGEIRGRSTTPHAVAVMYGYHVTVGGAGNHHCVVAVKPSDKVPKEIRIPLLGRYSFIVGDKKIRSELVANEFRLRFLGEKDGTAYNLKLPPPEELQEGGDKYKKLGAHILGTGSKVKVWVQDVYAWGTVIRRVENELQPKRPKFFVRWLREDWHDEEIELLSQDETDEPSNMDRWQHGWVHAEAS
jgi:alpha-tubulin suppressor-like RCC1 family protein